MLKKSASFVLASLGGSPYGPEYASPPRSLRPRWTALLNILNSALTVVVAVRYFALR
jgi:hypothetical protein